MNWTQWVFGAGLLLGPTTLAYIVLPRNSHVWHAMRAIIAFYTSIMTHMLCSAAFQWVYNPISWACLLLSSDHLTNTIVPFVDTWLVSHYDRREENNKIVWGCELGHISTKKN